jgi:hypothetical protein
MILENGVSPVDLQAVSDSGSAVTANREMSAIEDIDRVSERF